MTSPPVLSGLMKFTVHANNNSLLIIVKTVNCLHWNVLYRTEFWCTVNTLMLYDIIKLFWNNMLHVHFRVQQLCCGYWCSVLLWTLLIQWNSWIFHWYSVERIILNIQVNLQPMFKVLSPVSSRNCIFLQIFYNLSFGNKVYLLIWHPLVYFYVNRSTYEVVLPYLMNQGSCHVGR
jgi:hypothetical protein